MRHWKIISTIIAILGEGALQMSGFTCLPLAILLAVVIVVLLGWSCWPFIQRKILTHIPLKYMVSLIPVLAIIAVVIVVINMGHSQDGVSTPTPTPTPAQEWQWSHPSPQEISHEIDELPLYLQETAMQNYTGLSVTWGVTLFSVSDSPDGLRVYAYPSGQTRLLVTFTIDADDYPEIKTMQRGEGFVVQGVITQVDTLAIRLGDCYLTFD